MTSNQRQEKDYLLQTTAKKEAKRKPHQFASLVYSLNLRELSQLQVAADGRDPIMDFSYQINNFSKSSKGQWIN